MRDVFILGAGFAKAIHSNMPTLNELSDKVITRLQRLDFPIPSPLKKMDGNIEQWITYLSQRQPWLSEIENEYNRSMAGRIRNLIFEVIDKCTSLASISKAPAWLSGLIKTLHQNQAAIISLNYDTLIEKAAKEVQVANNVNEIWASQMYPPYFTEVRYRTGIGMWGPTPLTTFSFFKLHGSINWYYSGRDDFWGETILYSEETPFGNKVPDENSLRPEARDKVPLIIPPVLEKTTYFNNETVRKLWIEAGLAIKKAKRLFIIGYSLPASDIGMVFFLKKHSPEQSTPVYIVNVDHDITTHYRELLNWKFNTQFVQNQNPVEEFVRCYTKTPSSVTLKRSD